MLLLLKGHMGREHGDAQERSKIYVLKYTECHPPGYKYYDLRTEIM